MKTLHTVARISNYILAFLLCCAIGYIIFLYFNPNIERVYIQAKPDIKIVYVERSDSTTVASKTIPFSDRSEQMIDLDKTKEMYERLIPEVKDYKKEVQMLTEVRSTLEGQLQEKDIIIAQLQAGNPKPTSTTWKGQYMEITHYPESRSVDYKYNSVLQLAVTKEKDSVKVSASSPDKNNKINGMDTYVQGFKMPKRFSEVVLDGSIGKLNLDKDMSGLWGEGKVKWKFNPDGKFRPYIFGGATTDFQNVYYPFGLGAEYKITK